MSVINFRINKISAEKTNEEATNVNAKSNFVITSIKREAHEKIGDHLLVNFKFDVGYEPNLGKIDMEGTLWYTAPELDTVVSEKKGKIELKKDAVREISTAILRDSLVEAIDICKKLRLPIPLHFPKVDVKSSELAFKKAS